jgi:glycosyltransferase involved in cell wall biosynthesis
MHDARGVADVDLRVAMVIQAFTPRVGGGELQLERLLPHLAARGVQAEVITRGVPGAPHHDVVRGAPVIRTRLEGESPAAAIVYVASALAHIARRRRAFDVVHAHGALSPTTIALGATTLGLPAVVTPLGAGAPGDLARVQHKLLGRWRLQAAVRRARFVALSDEIRDELRALGVGAEHIHAIPNGFDTNRFHPLADGARAEQRDALGLPADGFVFLFVGRLHAVKGLDTVIDALGDVRDARLVVVGDGPERAPLEARARAWGVAPRVQFTGFQAGTERYMQTADAFVLPSIAEGMPNALVEAMACGMPCMASSASGGVRALLADGRGVLVAPRATSEWVRAMNELRSTSAEERRRIGAIAAQYVHASFSIERTADALTALYRGLASR